MRYKVHSKSYPMKEYDLRSAEAAAIAYAQQCMLDSNERIEVQPENQADAKTFIWQARVKPVLCRYLCYWQDDPDEARVIYDSASVRDAAKSFAGKNMTGTVCVRDIEGTIWSIYI